MAEVVRARHAAPLGVLAGVRGWLRPAAERDDRAHVLGVLARSPAEWPGAGAIALTDRHLVLDGRPRQRAALATIAAAEWEGRVVWVRRRRAHDWLLEMETEAEAGRVWRRIGRAIQA